jgi:hypothetical protein
MGLALIFLGCGGVLGFKANANWIQMLVFFLSCTASLAGMVLLMGCGIQSKSTRLHPSENAKVWTPPARNAMNFAGCCSGAFLFGLGSLLVSNAQFQSNPAGAVLNLFGYVASQSLIVFLWPGITLGRWTGLFHSLWPGWIVSSLIFGMLAYAVLCSVLAGLRPRKQK